MKFIYNYKNTNIFFDKLVDAFKLNKKLSLNKNYYNKLINAREVVYSINETILNEVNRYNLNEYEIISNKIEKKEEKQFKINYKSKEYFDIIDEWYFKWIKIIREINDDIILDLSGGIDTRILLSMILNANCNIPIRSKSFNKKIAGNESLEDYIISEKLIKKYNLSIAEIIKKPKILDWNNSYCIGESNYSSSIRNKPVKKLYRLCGHGSSLYHKPETFNKLLQKRFYNVTEDLKDDFYNYKNHFIYPSYLQEDLKDLFFYKKTIVNLRDGIKVIDHKRNNEIMLCPMFDPLINSLNPFDENGKSILPILILKRFLPELLNTEIEGIKDKNLNFNINIEQIKIDNYSKKEYNKQILFLHFLKEEYEKELNFKHIEDNSHSTGSEIGQTIFFKKMLDEYDIH